MYLHCATRVQTILRFVFSVLLIIIPNAADAGVYPHKTHTSASGGERIFADIPSEAYVPGVIVVKTTTEYPNPTTELSSFGSAALRKQLEPVDVKTIEAPYARPQASGKLIEDRYGIRRIYRIEFEADIDPLEVCASLHGLSDIVYAEPVYRRYLSHTPNDTRIGEQYVLLRIEAERAWDITTGSEDIVIAITDSGVDWEHEDLADNIWINPNEIAGDGIDNDNNGKIDDIRGWDYVGAATINDANIGNIIEDNDPKVRPAPTNVNDRRHHGTFVAGHASAVTNNGTGMASIGYNCRILPIKISSDHASLIGQIFRGYDAILYAAELGADIINCSWGGPFHSQAEQDIINQATALGSLVVAASGNEGNLTDVRQRHYPSGYRNVLAVGAVGPEEEVTDFSNYGIKTHVYAPGVETLSLISPDRYVANQVWAGTSFASPVVAGIAGLVKSIHPDWLPHQILHQIRSSSEDVITVPAQDRAHYYGRANAYRAVTVNASFTEGPRVPGISTAAIDVETDVNALDGYGSTEISLTVRNYLAPAADVTIVLESLDGLLTFEQTEFSTDELGTLAELELATNVQLSQLYPWARGEADVLISYRAADNYVDFERIGIPVQLSDNDSYNGVALSEDFEELGDNVAFYAAHSPDPNVLWAVGDRANSGLVVRASPFGVEDVQPEFAANPSYAIYAHSADVAIAGSNQADGSGAASIMRTTNGGSDWSAVSVSSITHFINHIHFFDEQNGIFLGDPITLRWGVGLTEDGGTTWANSAQVGSAQSGEQGVAGSATWLGDHGWFGTTAGRVFRTVNRGRNWNPVVVAEGGIITRLAFATPDSGIAVYRADDAEDAPTLIASTIDGGQTWNTDLFDISAAGIDVIAAYGPEKSAQTYVFGSFGQIAATADYGATWNAAITRLQDVDAEVGAGVINGSSVRLWELGLERVGYLDVEYEVANPVRLIAAQELTLAFDSLQVADEQTKSVRIDNTGEALITVTSSEIIPGVGSEPGEFEIITAINDIERGRSRNIFINFSPQKGGVRTATYRIISDAEPATLDIELIGYGKLETSVFEAGETGFALEIPAPHPAEDIVAISFSRVKPGHTRVDIINSLGETVATPWDGWAIAGRSTFELSTAQFPAGMYFIRLTSGGTSVMRKFLTLR